MRQAQNHTIFLWAAPRIHIILCASGIEDEVRSYDVLGI